MGLGLSPTRLRALKTIPGGERVGEGDVGPPQIVTVDWGLGGAGGASARRSRAADDFGFDPVGEIIQSNGATGGQAGDLEGAAETLES